jgi:transcriptional regulator with XRE-family HTH domain
MASFDAHRRALGRAVREQRAAAGLSRSDAGAAWGVSVGWLSRLERGELDPNLTELIELAAGIGTPPSALVRRVEELLAASG